MALSLLAALSIALVAWSGATAGYAPPQYLLGIVLPLAAVLVFLAGVCCRIAQWAARPVPFPIATTGGQQKSLPWIKPSCLEAPSTRLGVVGRMLLEVLFFRSLFRNTQAELVADTPQGGGRLVYWSSKWLWVFSILFHYSLLMVFIRHFRFFLEPVPICIQAAEFLDGILQVGVPRLFMSDALLLAGILLLLMRRLADAKLRYISLPADYFPLFLLIGVAVSGISMRYFTKVDVASVKVLTMGLVTFSPTLPANIGPAFFVHIAFVSALLIYFPFSKLMHMGGIFLSPTRNLPNNSREVMHINPWNGPKKYRTYEEYEDEFRDAMAEAGLPLEKQPENAPE